MLLSYNLLKRYVDLEGIDAFECADSLTRCGIEVEEVIPILYGSGLVTGFVESCESHPDSDHLNLTKVNVGHEVLDIVCGASNVAKGQYVIVAKVGAKLKDLEIKPTKIRGEASSGMICSLKELGLAEKFMTDSEKEGIKVLPKCELGIDPRLVLGLDDYSLDIKQTPNRSDFMSVFAIAHEVGAIFKREVRIPSINVEDIKSVDTELVVNSKTVNSDYFIGKIIGSIEVKDSVDWIRNALIGCGIKPINNVVDISNLVMLETGQPLHYYDYDFLQPKSLEVRDDFEGTLTALDGSDYDIEKGDLVIFNDNTPVGIAGIMGLGNSGIQKNSKGLVIEAARFDRVRIRKTATRLGLSTDSSQRFSKPYNLLATIDAVYRSVELLKEYAQASDIEATVIYGDIKYTPQEVSVSLTHINDLLGTKFKLEEVMDVFNSLNFSPIEKEGIITCTIPSYRMDIEIAEDLIEEVIRVLGFDCLEDTLPHLYLTSGSYTPYQEDMRYIEDYLLGIGANQVNTYTLISEKEVSDEAIALMSPMSESRTHLRTDLLPSLIETIRYNQSHKNNDLFIFETSKIYTQTSRVDVLAIAGSGNIYQTNWYTTSQNIDFFMIKGILVGLLDGLGINEKRLEFKSEGIDTTKFHPYQSAKIYLNRKEVGVIGTIHPEYAKKVGIKDVVYATINLTEILNVKRAKTKFKSLPKVQGATKDISISMNDTYSNSDIQKVIEKAAGNILHSLQVIDVYENEQTRSITYQLTLLDTKTLTDDIIHDTLDKVNNALNNIEGITVR